jgi:hypothetical protein
MWTILGLGALVLIAGGGVCASYLAWINDKQHEDAHHPH